MHQLPPDLGPGPFTRAHALELGASKAMFAGDRFVRVFPRVWRLAEHPLSEEGWVAAARLALPSRARLTGLTLIRRLGLDYGPQLPLHFVIEGDLHLDLDGIFLHRTKQLAPNDGESVIPAAAFVFYCSHARVIDAIRVGDWLLYWSHMTLDEVRSLALAALWRDGAHEAIWVCDYLDARSRSLKESETRALVEFAGLSRAESNVELSLGPNEPIVIADLVIRSCGLVLEYEGDHHQSERPQYCSDIDRYEVFRRNKIPYLQVTRERIRQPRKLVLTVHREMVRLGYDGPPPEFGERWRQLFRPVREVLGSRDEWLKAWAKGAVG